MKKGKLVLFCGPSGTGKGTICKFILSIFTTLCFSVSATTRKKRGEEVDGQDYYFLSVEEFKSKIAHDDFAEWEEVYTDKFYGTLKTEIERLWAEGKTVVFDVDVKGALKLKKIFGKRLLAISLKPRSVEVLRQRLLNRMTDTLEDIENRLAKAPAEIIQADLLDYPVVNDNLEFTKEKIRLRVKAFLLMPDHLLEEK